MRGGLRMMRRLAAPVGLALMVLAIAGAAVFAAQAQAPNPQIKPIVPDAWQGDAFGPSPI